MLRIEVATRNRDETQLRVEGWVGQASIAVLRTEVASQLACAQRLTLDLDGVRSIDRAGLDLLRRWSQQGVVLKGGSLYIRSLLKSHGLA